MKQVLFFSVVLAIPFFSISQGLAKPPEAFGITVSLPWINNYVYYNHELRGSSSKSGFVGLGASAFYKRGKRKFSLNSGFTEDLPAPIGAFDYGKEGIRSNISSVYVEELYHRPLLDRLNMIAGVNYVKYRFNLTSYVDTLASYALSNKTAGLTIGSEYRFSKFFAVALLYRPAIISSGAAQYRHLISLDARFDINFWRRE